MLFAGACGARTGLSEAERAEASDGGARDAGIVSTGCGRLRQVGDAQRLGSDDSLTRPQVISRGGAFDVTYGERGPTDWSYVVRRARGTSDGLALGASAEIGPEARGVGALAAGGDRLGFCYGARDLGGPTRFARTDALDYGAIARSTVGDEAGDHCYGLAFAGGRWLAAWNHRAPSPFQHAVAELDDDGALVGGFVVHEGSILDVEPRGDGFVYAVRDPFDSARVVVLTQIAPDSRGVALDNPSRFAIDEVDTVASPFEVGAIEVGFRDVDGEATWLRVGAGGAVSPPTDLASAAAIATGPQLAVVADRLAIVETACDGAVEGPGRLTLRTASRDALGPPLRVDRPACPTSPRVAVAGRDVAVVWVEDDRPFGALFRCAE